MSASTQPGQVRHPSLILLLRFYINGNDSLLNYDPASQTSTKYATKQISIYVPQPVQDKVLANPRCHNGNDSIAVETCISALHISL